MKNVKAEIVAVGTELLLGQIANTNAQWISQQLAKYGITVHFHAVVGDNLQRVETTFRQASSRSDIVIVTGGLGPTEDDLTREAFQLVSNLEMKEATEALHRISAYFEKQQTEMTPNNRKQANVFSTAHVLKNSVGMAPGMIVPYKGKTWVFLPGVPSEMKQMFTNEVIPYIVKLTGTDTVIQSMILRFSGIGEAKLEHELFELIHHQSNPTIAPLAQKDGVVIRLTVKENSIEKANARLEEAKRRVLEKVGPYYIGMEHETIEQRAVSLLRDKQMRIGAAESLTGGMFTEKLISVEGASKVCPGGIVCYDSEIKQKVLGVSNETIEAYGTVSQQCAEEMAKQAAIVLDASIGISFTGVAGPDSLEGKPVGTVFISLFHINGTIRTEKATFIGDREAVRSRATRKGFELLIEFVKHHSQN
ncbi:MULTISPECIES: competence/damage-inducible protein A [unclassified Virgibacillus]|uniref:competence/damage-inducible protein A n=1 Tax=unclassified Virgibacillus TaxID=2620237 RepID=UPI0024DE453D|nr:competence/damage-inducible protein A [Virgibacillus sp. LDC-1]